MQYFFTQELIDEGAILKDEEYHHLKNVLRKQPGDIVWLVDGHGNKYEAAISEMQKREGSFKILRTINETKRNYELEVAISPTKNIGRFEWFLEKATEIGIDRIIPIQCHRTERNRLKPERLRKILISAMKQSGQAWLPELAPMVSFKNYIGSIPGPAPNHQRFIGYLDGPTRSLASQLELQMNYTVLIGPEGDFDKGEVSMAMNEGFLPMTLGTSRLRVETAAILVTATVQSLNSR